MLMQHLSPPRRSQLPHLLGFLTQIHRSRSQSQVKLNRFPLQLAYLELHVKSLRRKHPAVNALANSDQTKESAGPVCCTCQRRLFDCNGFTEINT
jgi:hypothetical protein